MEDLQGKIITGLISTIVTVLAAILLRRLEPRAKVVWWGTRPTIFQIPVLAPAPSVTVLPPSENQSTAVAVDSANNVQQSQSSFLLATTSTFITNVGKKKAESVEICHRRRPENFKLFPSLQYQEDYTPDGAHIIKINSLGPKQTVVIEYLAMAMMPELNYIRTEDSMCESIEVIPQIRIPRWQEWLAAVLMLVGAAAIIVCLSTLLSIPLTRLSSTITHSAGETAR